MRHKESNMAIYQGNTKISGSGIEVDSSLSDSSTNPVQNQAVTEALEDVGYSTWQKPADWIDIRSGALSNSVYFLVGHSADYSQYPNFFVNATISNSGTYDVFVDGIKQATTASGTATTLNWQTLALETGFDVTTPTNLRAHIVRVTPSVSTNTITKLTCNGSYTNPTNRTGLLWAHFTITNEFNAEELFGAGNGYRSSMLQAVTSANGILNVSRLSSAFYNAEALIEIPTISSPSSPSNLKAWGACYGCKSLKKAVFDKITTANDANNFFGQCYSLKTIEGLCASPTSGCFEDCYKLEKLPPISTTGYLRAVPLLKRNRALAPTYLDLSWFSACKALTASGVEANYFIEGLKGLIVSNEAPFDHTTSPQIDVSYTGLDRTALRQLFKSMPTVSAGQVCNITGTTGASALTAEDLAIATDKGWTITR